MFKELNGLSGPSSAKITSSQLSCNPEDQLGLSPDEWSFHTVLPCSEDIPEVEDQHIWFGWCLLNLCFKKAKATEPMMMGVNCVDPLLSKLVLDNASNPEQQEGLKKGVRDSMLLSTELLLIPVYSGHHWACAATHLEEVWLPQQGA